MLQRVFGFGLVFTVAVFLFGGVLADVFDADNFLSANFYSSKQKTKNAYKRKSKNSESDHGGSEQSKIFDADFVFQNTSARLSLKRNFF